MTDKLTEAQYIEMYITFHTRHLPTFNERFTKLSDSFAKLKKGETLEEQDKVYFKEYAMMRNIAFLKSYAEHLEKYNLAELVDKVDQCHEMVIFFEQAESHKHYQLGMFIAPEKIQGTLTTQALKDYYTALTRFVLFALDDPSQEQTIKPDKR